LEGFCADFDAFRFASRGIDNQLVGCEGFGMSTFARSLLWGMCSDYCPSDLVSSAQSLTLSIVLRHTSRRSRTSCRDEGLPLASLGISSLAVLKNCGQLNVPTS